MGRHRRSAAGRAARGAGTADSPGRGHHPSAPDPGTGPTTGIAPWLDPEAYAEARAKSDAYLFAPGDPAGDGRPATGRTLPFRSAGSEPGAGSRRAGARRRGKLSATPVRAGLLGVSAAVALGTIAVATGAVPGLDTYRLGGGPGDQRVRSADVATNSPTEQGGALGSADTGRGPAGPAGGDTGRSASAPPSSSPASASPTSPSTSASASATPSARASAPASTTPSGTGRTEAAAPAPPRASTAPRTTTAQPERRSAAPALASEQAVAGAQVLRLVNEERATAGCSPVAANSALRELAEDFSRAMAAQGFFDHTDPAGNTPWDRAEAAGTSDLGGENIARGQADAQAVMDAWMNSPDHRANILNCDFKTLGVGVHFGPGGPWWTQDFGY